jgi:chromosome segregation ATPase
MDKVKKDNEDLQFDIQRLSEELILKRAEISKVSLHNEALKSALASMNPNVAQASQSIEEVVKRLDQQMSRVDRGRAGSWEIEKANQKKLETVKEKLKEKVSEAESLLASNTNLRETLSRSERDRLRLQKKLQKLTEDKESNKSESSSALSLSKEVITQLEAKNAALQAALTKATKKLNGATSKSPEIISLPSFDTQDLTGKTNSELISLVSTMQAKELQANMLAKEMANLKCELQAAIDREKAARESASHVTKLDEVNSKLRTRLKKETERAKSAIDKSEELAVTNEQLIKDILSLRKLVGGVPESQSIAHEQSQIIDSLKKAVQEKEKVIQELLANPDSNEGTRMIAENRRLKRDLEMWQLRVTKMTNESKPLVTNTKLYEENERLKVQIKTLTEEVEDLRFNYKDLVRKSVTQSTQ